MTRREARRVLEEIRIGQRICVATAHFRHQLVAREYSMEDVEHVLFRCRFVKGPEVQREGVWRVTLEGEDVEGGTAWLLLDISEAWASAYVTIYPR